RLCRMYAGRGLNCCDVATEQHRPQICGMVVFVAGSTAPVAITVAGGGFQWATGSFPLFGGLYSRLPRAGLLFRLVLPWRDRRLHPRPAITGPGGTFA